MTADKTADKTAEETVTEPSAHEGAVYEAVRRALATAYGDQEPAHFGVVTRWRDGGPDPLDGISVYWNPSGPHWHYVSFGMAEHGEKESTFAEVSGWGFELSLRLAAPVALGDRADEPADGPGHRVRKVATLAPTWPIALLNELGRHVFKTRKPFQHGNLIHRPGAGYLPDLCFLREADLPMADTPNGRFVWHQVVALDEAQVARMKGDDWEELVAELRAADPHLLIRPEQGPAGSV